MFNPRYNELFLTKSNYLVSKHSEGEKIEQFLQFSQALHYPKARTSGSYGVYVTENLGSEPGCLLQVGKSVGQEHCVVEID